MTLAGISAEATCSPASPAPSVTICAPVAGATVASPVNLQAGAASNAAVTKFLVYVDGSLVYQTANTKSINADVNIAPGTHKLTAQIYNGAWVKKSETFTVLNAVSVSIAPGSANMQPNATQEFTATVKNTSNTSVNWSVDGVANGNSGVGTITGMGPEVTYQAPGSTGSHKVEATSVADSSKSGSAAVNVTLTPGTFPSSKHVFLILEENQSFSRVFPSGDATDCASAGMPYLCGLAAANGLAVNFYSNYHGSLKDYLYATSGSAWAASPENCTGGGCARKGVITGENLVRALSKAGKSWRGYFEDLPSAGYMGGDTGNYVLHHNPFPWYSDVEDSAAQQRKMVPLTQFTKDVQANTFQSFNLIVPNSLHDAYLPFTESSGTLLARADSWLQSNIAPLLSTPPFQAGGDGILIVAFDEGNVKGEGSTTSDNSCSPTQLSGCGGHVAFVMIGPNVIHGAASSTTYHFQDMMHTIIHLLGLTDYMNGASGGVDMTLLPGVQ